MEFEQLRNLYGKNKYIPAKYEKEILVALSHYPELKNTNIQFVLAVHAATPYTTKPSFKSCFLPKSKRVYTITILEHSDRPTEEALMKNLNPRMRIGVLGHELAHVIQYNRCNALSLIRTLLSYIRNSFRKNLERSADLAAIEHGLGEELLEHAEYIRKIPGYVEKRPDLVKDYLQPSEIEYYLRHSEEIFHAS